ncbi:MAG TPA: ankyrin repeat domain-containing protein [Opitutaceae bacterium]|nr:ankyrin repeat domain-containing protein [Opitutaceae bacterium]HRJ46920.1 ankyrin repeat domain-containing protein [Opitutaceae bacterium]
MIKLSTCCLLLLLLAVGCTRSKETVRLGVLNYNVVDVFGHTPALALVRAVAKGDRQAIEEELRAGVDPNTVGKHDITPLWWAAVANNLPGFTALMENGADPNFKRAEGNSLMIIVSESWLLKLDFLAAALRHGGNPNFRDSKSGETPLHLAVRYGQREQIDLLLAAGADLNIQDGGGGTPMMSMIGARGDYRLVWEFLQRGADYTIKTNSGHTLADTIRVRRINPSGRNYEWREKVMAFLKDKGVEVQKPENE